MAAHNPDAETGNNIASWTAIIVCFVGFLIAAFAVVTQTWPLLWVGIVAILVSPIIGLVLAKMGFGEERARAKRAQRLEEVRG